MTAHAPAPPVQPAFRVLVDAISHPGRAYALGPVCEALDAPPLVAIARCLLDHETSFAAVGPAAAKLREQIFQACKAAVVEPAIADYIFVDGARSDGALAAARRGELAFPDRGATLVYRLPADGAALDLRLSGPGIPGSRTPELVGLDADELALLATVNAGFPLGCDCFFVDARRRVMAIPRSTHLVAQPGRAASGPEKGS